MLRPPPDTIPSTTLRPETGTPSCIAASQSSAFHEKAGMSQVCFFLFSFFFLWIPSVRAGPPLSPSFHPHSWLSDCRSVHGGRSQFEKAGTSEVCFVLFSFFFLWIPSVRAGPPLSPSFHPHSWLSDCRSVHGGRSQFSRCCYLIIDLCFPLSKETGPGTGAVT